MFTLLFFAAHGSPGDPCDLLLTGWTWHFWERCELQNQLDLRANVLKHPINEQMKPVFDPTFIYVSDVFGDSLGGFHVLDIDTTGALRNAYIYVDVTIDLAVKAPVAEQLLFSVFNSVQGELSNVTVVGIVNFVNFQPKQFTKVLLSKFFGQVSTRSYDRSLPGSRFRDLYSNLVFMLNGAIATNRTEAGCEIVSGVTSLDQFLPTGKFDPNVRLEIQVPAATQILMDALYRTDVSFRLGQQLVSIAVKTPFDYAKLPEVVADMYVSPLMIAAQRYNDVGAWNVIRVARVGYEAYQSTGALVGTIFTASNQAIGVSDDLFTHNCFLELFDLIEQRCVSQGYCQSRGRVKHQAVCLPHCPRGLWLADGECYRVCPRSLGYVSQKMLPTDDQDQPRCRKCSETLFAGLLGCLDSCGVENTYRLGCYADCPAGTLYDGILQVCKTPAQSSPDMITRPCAGETPFHAQETDNGAFLRREDRCTPFPPPGLYLTVYLDDARYNLTNNYVSNCSGQVLLNGSCALNLTASPQGYCADAVLIRPLQPAWLRADRKKCILQCPPPYVNRSHQCVLGCQEAQFVYGNAARCQECGTLYSGGFFFNRSTERCQLQCARINSSSVGKICEEIGEYCTRYVGLEWDGKQLQCISDCGETNNLFQSRQDINLCLRRCPPGEFPYKKKCTRYECLPEEFYSAGTCSDSCPEAAYEVDAATKRYKTCVDSCTQFGIVQPKNEHNNYYYSYQFCPPQYQCPHRDTPAAQFLLKENLELSTEPCVSSCPRYTVLYSKTCVKECPQKFFVFTQDGTKQCRNGCDDAADTLSTYTNPHEVEDYMRCDTRCIDPSYGLRYKRSCVQKCPAGFYKSDLECVQICPEERRYSESSVCAPRCASALYTKSVLGNLTHFICGSSCPTGWRYRRLDKNGMLECMEFCPDGEYVSEELVSGRKVLLCVRLCPTNGTLGQACTQPCHSAVNNLTDINFNTICRPSCSSEQFMHVDQCVSVCPVARPFQSTSRKCRPSCDTGEVWTISTQNASQKVCSANCSHLRPVFSAEEGCTVSCDSNFYRLQARGGLTLRYCIDYCIEGILWKEDDVALVASTGVRSFRCLENCTEINLLKTSSGDGCTRDCPSGVVNGTRAQCLDSMADCVYWRRNLTSGGLVCLQECAPGEVHYPVSGYQGFKCAARCPPDLPYIEINSTCVSACGFGVAILQEVEEEKQGGVFVNFDSRVCLRDLEKCRYEFYQDGHRWCGTVCEHYIQVKECVVKCDPGFAPAKLDFQNYCVPNCPIIPPGKIVETLEIQLREQVYLDVDGTCQSECSTGIFISSGHAAKRVCLQNTSSCNVVHESNVHSEMECLTRCRPGYVVEMNGSCVLACKSAKAFLDSTDHCVFYCESRMYNVTDRRCIYKLDECKHYIQEKIQVNINGEIVSLIYKICRPQCPSTAPYTSPVGLCQAEACGRFGTNPGRVCLDSFRGCTQVWISRINRSIQCVAKCNYYVTGATYAGHEFSECLTQCPVDKARQNPTLGGYRCDATCKAPYNLFIRTTQICTAVCPMHLVELDGECVTQCPHGFTVMSGRCQAADCPKKYFINNVHDKVCVQERCPAKYHLLGEFHCVAKCPAGYHVQGQHCVPKPKLEWIGIAIAALIIIVMGWLIWWKRAQLRHNIEVFRQKIAARKK